MPIPIPGLQAQLTTSSVELLGLPPAATIPLSTALPISQPKFNGRVLSLKAHELRNEVGEELILN